MRFFKIANRIFDYQLSPASFLVYSFLSSKKNCFGSITISYQAIAEGCNMNPKTACRAINELIGHQLIAKEQRYNFIGYAKNRYLVNTLTGGWFKMEYQLFKTNIKSTDFMIYAYIKKCMDLSGDAFPSLTAISKATGISRSRVATGIRFLREYSYLNRVKRRYKKTQAFRHSRYLMFNIQKKKEVRSAKRTSFKKLIIKNNQFLVSIIEQGAKNVKLFFYSRGSPKIPQQCLDPQGRTLLRKNIFIL